MVSSLTIPGRRHLTILICLLVSWLSASALSAASVTAPPPVITSPTAATGQVGVPFIYLITAINTPTAYATSALPTGLTVDTVTGSITGTPVAPSFSAVTLSATNASGTGVASLLLAISEVSTRPPTTTNQNHTLTEGACGSGGGMALVACWLIVRRRRSLHP